MRMHIDDRVKRAISFLWDLLFRIGLLATLFSLLTLVIVILNILLGHSASPMFEVIHNEDLSFWLNVLSHGLQILGIYMFVNFCLSSRSISDE